VQDIIRAGKEGNFTELPDGSVQILDETLAPDEVRIVYRGTEGKNIAADNGIVVSMDTALTDALRLEGEARDIIRAIQRLRKEEGLEFTDAISASISGADDILSAYGETIAQETHAILGSADGKEHTIELPDRKVTVRFSKR
ncbi:hypothetical protein GX553_04165, partial [Candidatus Peribacteria bacterium]|nr:hypothetical protein [Candidatus Peribacteria bacterium]